MVTRRSFFPRFLSCSVWPCLGPGYVRRDFIGFYSGKGRLRQRRFPLLPPTETKNRNEIRRLIGQVGGIHRVSSTSLLPASKGANLVMVISRGRCEEANPCPSRFRRSGRSILNRKSDFTCAAAASPHNRFAGSFVRSFFGVEEPKVDRQSGRFKTPKMDRPTTIGRRTLPATLSAFVQRRRQIPSWRCRSLQEFSP